MSEWSETTLPVLVIDDEIQTLNSCRIVLRSSGIGNVVCCQDSRQVMDILSHREIGVVLLDLSMPHISGNDLLTQIRQDYPLIPVIIITGANDVEIAVDCMKKGAFDYMVKPVEKSRLISGVKRALELRELERENILLKNRILDHRIDRPDAFSEIITNNAKMRSIFQYVEAIAGTNQPVLITGETGVGKELMAKAIYKLSLLKGRFTAVNVSGLDDNLFADTLFGHKKGAYTGAMEARDGLVEYASGGALFLDEIGDLSAVSQVKLLRLIQEGEYLPLGSDIVKHSSVRIIVATNQELHAAMNRGQFRKDLYYRLQTHHVHIPALRERMDDLPFLLEHFIEQTAKSLKKRKPAISPGILSLLSLYDFPGNVRELQSMVFDAVSKNTSNALSLDVFQSRILKDAQPDFNESALHDISLEPVISFSEKIPTLKEANQRLILEAMKRADGNQTLAARLLGISQQALSRRLKYMK
ncbi:sigma-54-dependent Fis family transcriptional regulator [Candidatus Sumerlaeota bacterium]|nr:sigma-54-dependent Fis family transcriptional regulator [Candidatus Sumerlaeota bacterium]